MNDKKIKIAIRNLGPFYDNQWTLDLLSEEERDRAED